MEPIHAGQASPPPAQEEVKKGNCYGRIFTVLRNTVIRICQAILNFFIDLPENLKRSVGLTLENFKFEDQTYQIQITEGGGSCGLHALLGVWNGARVSAGDKIRHEVVNTLTPFLDNLDNQSEFFRLYKNILIDFVEDFGRKGHGAILNARVFVKPITQETQAFLTRANTLQNEFVQVKQACHDDFLKICKQIKSETRENFPELLVALDLSQTLEKVEEVFGNDALLKNQILENINNVTAFMNTLAHESIQAVLDKENEMEEHKQQFILAPKVKTAYLTTLLQPSYWVTTQEIKLIAHARQLSMIIVYECCDHTIDIAESHRIEGKQNITIYNNGGTHYSQCQIV